MRENLLAVTEKRLDAKLADLKDREARIKAAMDNRDKAEAERFAADARATLATQIERRAKQAQEKIAQAEAHAMAEIRALAADAAAAAAEKIITTRLDEQRAANLVSASLKDLSAKLN